MAADGQGGGRRAGPGAGRTSNIAFAPDSSPRRTTPTLALPARGREAGSIAGCDPSLNPLVRILPRGRVIAEDVRRLLSPLPEGEVGPQVRERV